MKLRHLNALRALEAALRLGSLGAAADEIEVTKAAIGRQIRALESALGIVLFDRGPAGLVPRPEAREVAAQLTAGFSALADVLESWESGASDRRVAVTLPESFAVNWFTPRVADFYRQASEVDLRLDASNRRQDIVAGPFQFAIRYAPPPDAGLAADPLFGDCVLPVCTPAFAARHGLEATTRCLHGVPLIHLDNRTPDPDWAGWPDWAGRAGIAWEETAGQVRFSRVVSGLEAALSGQGLVLGGLVEAHDALAAGRLVAPWGVSRSVPTGYVYRLLWREGRRLSPVQRRFRDWVVDTAQAFMTANPTLPAPG